MSGFDEVVEFINDTEWEDLPEPVRERAMMACVDDLASLIAGRAADVSEITANYASRSWAGGRSTIFQNGEKASSEGAAFANATAANALDIDDCGLYTKGHPGAQVFPTALALGEELGATGKEVLAGIVVGYEAGARVARCWHDFYETYRAGGSWGSVACASVSARLMDLTLSETKEAFKVAEYNSPYIPIIRGVRNPGMVKHGVGLGAFNGIASAKLAGDGFTGSDSVLENEKYEEWLGDLGDRYLLVDGVVWKEYASCAWTHPALDAVRDLNEEHDIDPGDIRSIEVLTHEKACQLGTELPGTTEEAQFNLAWPVAALLVDGEVGPAQIKEERLSDPVIRGLAEKVHARESRELTRMYDLAVKGESGGGHVAEVRLETATGRELSSGRVEGNIRYPPKDWNPEKIEGKFSWLVEDVLCSAKADRLLEETTGMLEVEDVRDYCSNCIEIIGE